MNVANRFNALQFDHDPVLNHQIHPVTEINRYPIVDYRQLNLIFDFQTLLTQFVQEASLIGAFQQSRPKSRVNAHRTSYYHPANVIYRPQVLKNWVDGCRQHSMTSGGR